MRFADPPYGVAYGVRLMLFLFVALSYHNEMPDYRRYRVPGGTYFLTINLLERGSSLLTVEIVALREAVRRVRATRPFHIDAWVVLPDHMHCLWTLPAGDADYSGRVRWMKIWFSRSRPATEWRPACRYRSGERGLWQQRFWEHTIRDDRDYAAHLDYIHFNPVKHGLVDHPADWPFSTCRTCVSRGLYPPDWSTPVASPLETGEFAP